MDVCFGPHGARITGAARRLSAAAAFDGAAPLISMEARDAAVNSDPASRLTALTVASRRGFTARRLAYVVLRASNRPSRRSSARCPLSLGKQ